MSNIGPLKITVPVTLESLEVDFRLLHAQVFNSLRHLDFVDNFEAKEMTVEFSGTAEVAIPNPLQGPIPTRWIVTDVQGGAFTPCRGSTEWTTEFLYLQNPASGTITAKILFFR